MKPATNRDRDTTEPDDDVIVRECERDSDSLWRENRTFAMTTLFGPIAATLGVLQDFSGFLGEASWGRQPECGVEVRQLDELYFRMK